MILKDESGVRGLIHDINLPTEIKINEYMIFELHNTKTPHQFRSALVDHIVHPHIPSLDN